METEAMYEGRDVASMTPRIFDRTSCRRCRGSIRQSVLAGAIYGFADRQYEHRQVIACENPMITTNVMNIITRGE